MKLRINKQSPWFWGLTGSLSVLVVSPLAATSTGIEFLYPLSLLPLSMLLWTLTRLPSRAMGLRLGPVRTHVLAVMYPVFVMGLTGLIAYLSGSIRATHFPVLAVSKGVLLIFLFTLALGPLTEEGFFRGWLWGVLEASGTKL